MKKFTALLKEVDGEVHAELVCLAWSNPHVHAYCTHAYMQGYLPVLSILLYAPQFVLAHAHN